jgi:hypothetical protein
MFRKLTMPTMPNSGRVPSNREAVLERGTARRALQDGAFRERALNVEAIADSVRAGWSASGDPGTVGGPSLAEGAAGLAVLFA